MTEKLSEKDIENFLGSLKTVTTEILEDSNNLNKKGYLSKNSFFNKYGHLRPGTYDILSKKYSEKKYFSFELCFLRFLISLLLILSLFKSANNTK